MTVVRLIIFGMGVLALVDAVALILRRWNEHPRYGGRAAFIVHVCTLIAAGVILTAAATVQLPLQTVAYIGIGIGLTDLIVGVFARRRNSSRRGHSLDDS